MKWTTWAKQEDGGILVTATIGMLALFFMGVALVQVGTWFQDRRHLQVRADAGALAGGQLFNECFNTAAFPPATAKADMEKSASQYAGFSKYLGNPLVGQFAPPRNASFGSGGSSNAALFQSTTYPGGGGGSDDTNIANECDSGNLALDIKLTRDVGGMFTISPLAHVHAHARVQLKEVQSVTPTFPLAIPEIVPNAVGVTFINEDASPPVELTGCTGAVVAGTTCTYKLANIAAAGTDPYNLGPWEITGAGVNLPAFSGTTPLVRHIGMRVGVGTAVSATVVASCANSSGNGSDWQCFNNTALGQGAVTVDEVNPSTSIAAPRLQGLWPNTCTGSPFDGDDTRNPCTASVTAQVVSTGLSNFRMRAKITQNGGATVTSPLLTFSGGQYTWPAPLPTVNVNPTTGASDYTVSLCWGSGGGNATNNCPALWRHRVVGATDVDDGPLQSVTLSDGTGGSPYSYNSSGIKTFKIDVTLKAPFNKLTVLRQSHNGSATAFILCRWKNPSDHTKGVEGGDPGVVDAVASGCQVPFQVNRAVPPTCSPDPLTSPESYEVPDCTQNKPSTAMGNKITDALNTRFGCVKNQAPVHANLWPNYSTVGDTRAVTLVTTTYDAYAKNGSNPYPVTGFGAFYIAAFSGSDCGSLDAPWDPKFGPTPGKNDGTIWGYFIKYTNLDGTPSGRACKLNSLNNCVAVLTR